MSDAPEGTPAEPEAKTGEAAWRERRDEIADRNAAASKRGQAERKIALSRVTEQRRLNAQREQATLHAMNSKLTKARPRG